MKTVSVIYDCCTNYPAIDHNKQTLEQIFETHILVENCYFDQLKEGELLSGDAFLLSNERLLSPLKTHIQDFKKVVIMNRSIGKAGLPAIFDIPAGTDVLLVNDSYETSVHTVYSLYELGISHLNLIPYDEALESSGIYRSLDYALTPNEAWLIPPYIKNIVNIGYRVISFDTLLKLTGVLGLDAAVINRNLIRYLRSLAENNSHFHANYLDSYLKGQMLNLVIHDSPSAILVVNDSNQLVYSNEQANLLLRLDEGRSAPLSSLIGQEMASLIHSSANNSLITFQEENYVLEKSPLMLMDQLMGYCITLQNEKNLRQIEINLNSHLRQKGLYARHRFEDIIHVSPAMEACISTAKQAAVTDYTILIRGESGTGKELIAQSIHNYSRRKDCPFVAINCAALPESLLESQLFGYEGGSFTGAQKSGKPGLFEQAHRGTIFLDEIGDISPNLQSQLLRVLQEKQIMRIGSDKIITIDVRVIAATNRNLEEQVRCGKFRSDLFYRLNVIPILIEPLRRRREDILPLLAVFLGNAWSQVSEEERQQLTRYHWPGNVRQLESAAIYYKTLHAFPAYLNESGEDPSEQAPTKYASVSEQALEPAQSHTSESVQSHAPVPAQAHAPVNAQGFSLRLPNDSEELNTLILQLIASATAPFHGIGRSALQQQLCASGITMSDGKLRLLLVDLEQQGLITISRGRRGCQITGAGADRLRYDK